MPRVMTDWEAKKLHIRFRQWENAHNRIIAESLQSDFDKAVEIVGVRNLPAELPQNMKIDFAKRKDYAAQQGLTLEQLLAQNISAQRSALEQDGPVQFDTRIGGHGQSAVRNREIRELQAKKAF